MGVINQLITRGHDSCSNLNLGEPEHPPILSYVLSHRSKPLWLVHGFPGLPRLMTPTSGANVANVLIAM